MVWAQGWMGMNLQAVGEAADTSAASFFVNSQVMLCRCLALGFIVCHVYSKRDYEKEADVQKVTNVCDCSLALSS